LHGARATSKVPLNHHCQYHTGLLPRRSLKSQGFQADSEALVPKMSSRRALKMSLSHWMANDGKLPVKPQGPHTMPFKVKLN